MGLTPPHKREGVGFSCQTSRCPIPPTLQKEVTSGDILWQKHPAKSSSRPKATLTNQCKGPLADEVEKSSLNQQELKTLSFLRVCVTVCHNFTGLRFVYRPSLLILDKNRKDRNNFFWMPWSAARYCKPRNPYTVMVALKAFYLTRYATFKTNRN